MPEQDKKQRDVNAPVFSAVCDSHGPVGQADSQDSANQLAADHLKKSHADAQGNVAPSSRVAISQSTYVSAADLPNLQQKQQGQQGAVQSGGGAIGEHEQH